MWNALKGVFTSKTTWVAVIGSAVLTLLGFALPALGLGEEMVTQILTWVGVLFGGKVGQQAAADLGKNKA